MGTWVFSKDFSLVHMTVIWKCLYRNLWAQQTSTQISVSSKT